MGSEVFETIGKYMQQDPDNQEGVEKRTFKWRVLWAIIVLIGGAFTIGFTASSTVSERKVAQLERKIQKLEEQQEKLLRESKITETKKEFKRRALRYEKAKEALARFPSNKNLQEQVKEDRQAFATFIVQKAGQEKDEVGIPVMKVVKGDTSAESVVKFDGDESLYVVPSEVKKLTPPGTFFRADAGAGDRLKLSPGCPKWVPVFTDSRNKQTQNLTIDIARIH